MSKLSIVVPAYNEAANLPALYESLRKTLSALSTEWECIIVDDHSGDATFSVVSALAIQDRRIRGIRLARNHGSHLAISGKARRSRPWPSLGFSTFSCVIWSASVRCRPPAPILC